MTACLSTVALRITTRRKTAKPTKWQTDTTAGQPAIVRCMYHIGGSSRQSRSVPSSAAATLEEEEAAAAAQAACCVAILMQHPTNAHAMKKAGGLRQLAELIFDSEDSEVVWESLGACLTSLFGACRVMCWPWFGSEGLVREATWLVLCKEHGDEGKQGCWLLAGCCCRCCWPSAMHT